MCYNLGMKLKFITLNVWYGGKLFDEVVTFLKKENPDILAIQEAYDEKDEHLDRAYRTLAVLSKELRLAYSSFAPEFRLHINGSSAVMGNAILSRFQMKEMGAVFFRELFGDIYGSVRAEIPFYPRNLQHVMVDVHGRMLHVFNTHGVWGEDGLDNPRRLEMGRKIVQQVQGKERVVLSGDFNVNQGTKTIGMLAEVLKDVFEGELITSFNMKQKSGQGFGTAVVDRIFVSDDIHVLEHYRPDVNVSDHMPLVVELEF